MKLLAVCGFGVGSSMILKMTLENVFRIKGIPVEVENTDITGAKAIPCDAIFTSAELKNEIQSAVSVPIYAVKKYMDREEVTEHVTQFLAERSE